MAECVPFYHYTGDAPCYVDRAVPLPLTDTAMHRFALTILLAFMSMLAQAQPVFHLDSLPTAGVLLDKGWTFHAGDNLDFARPEFDDKSWEPLNPALDIFELPQVPKTGKIGWLRLHLVLTLPFYKISWH